jgi:hypothetical protein
MAGNTIKSMTDWAKKKLGVLLVDVWCEKEPYDSEERLHEFRVIYEGNINDDSIPDKVKNRFAELPESVVLVDMILYGWRKGRGALHIVSCQDQQETFKYFKKQEAEDKKLEKALRAQETGPAPPPVPGDDSDDLDDDEDASLENYIALCRSIRCAKADDKFPVRGVLEIYVGQCAPNEKARKMRLLETLLPASREMRNLAIFEPQDEYEINGWKISKRSLPELYKRIAGQRGKWGPLSEDGRKLMWDLSDLS